MKEYGRSVIGYVCTLLGVVFLLATLAIFSDWTSLRGPTKVVSASAAGLATGVTMLSGFRLLRDDANADA